MNAWIRVSTLFLVGAVLGAGCSSSGPGSEAPGTGPKPAQSRRMMTATLSTASICDAPAPANAVYLFVSKSGNDSTAAAGDRTLPYLTLAAAWAAVPTTLPAPYVIEILDSGTYAESLNLSGKTTSATHTFTLRTAPGAAPKLTGGGTTLLTIGMSYVTVEGLDLDVATGTPDGVVLSTATSNTQLLCNVIRTNGNGIVSTTSAQTNLLIEGNRILSNETSGIVITGGSAGATSGLVIRRNVIALNGTGANPGPALDIKNASGPLVANNTFWNNTRSPSAPAAGADVRATDGVTGMVFKNNVLAGDTTDANKRSVHVLTASTLAASSNYNLYHYPGVTPEPSGTCRNAGDTFMVGTGCRCFASATTVCSSAVSWQNASGADKMGSTGTGSGSNPLFTSVSTEDFHEQSTGGRWTASGWVVDFASSPVLDTGDPADPVGDEPAPNGGRINRGAYGGGSQASRSPGVKAVVVSRNATAGQSVTVTVQLQDAYGNPFQFNPNNQDNNYVATVTTSGSATPRSQTITIDRKFSSTTFSITDFVAEKVTLSLTQVSGPEVQETTGTVDFLPTVLDEVSSLSVHSSNGANVLFWSNPARHDGVVILRSATAVPNTNPSDFTSYSVGTTLGNATVVYADSQSFATRMTDAGLTNGTRYYYRVFNRDSSGKYSPGQVPTSSGIFGVPTAGGASPAWCYNVGLPTLQQPYVLFGAGLFSSSNARAVISNIIAPGSRSDGWERWRPAAVSGVVQARATVLPLTGHSGMKILVGDQDGYAYAIDATTGQPTWVGNGGAPLTPGATLQAQPAVQANSSNAAFAAKYPGQDLIFFATAGTSRTANKVHALSSLDGSIKWSFPSDSTPLDIVSGGLMVDMVNNRLWVGSRSGASGAQGSLWIIDTLTGAAARAPYQLGNVDAAVIRNPIHNQAYAVNTAGMAYGFDLTTMEQLWSFDLGAPIRGFLVPVGRGFIASTASGVQRYEILSSPTYSVRPMWPSVESPAATAVSGASAARVDFGNNNKAYVSDDSGRIHKLDLFTGANLGSVTVSNGILGTPALDSTTTPKRLYVGGIDGRVCAVELF